MRLFALWILLLGASQVEALEVRNLRVWPAPDNTRVVFDLSAAARYDIFTIADPPRVVVDLQAATVTGKLPQPGPESRLLRAVRHGARGGGDLRVVFDVSKPVTARSSLLGPNERYGHRLLIELADEPFAVVPPLARAADTAAPIAMPAGSAPKSAAIAPGGGRRDRSIIVAIDAGHGGEDPGATGRHGTREKDITLAIARQLADAVNREQGLRAVLTRDGDYFIPLRKRIEKARQHHADLFVSVHADAYRNPRVAGSSVYVLSQRGASSEAARWLANQENASDYIGGITLEDKDDMLKSVLLDLSQTASIEASVDVAREVLDRLDRVGNIRKRQVQHGGFVVLKSPDIPSILVETAYLTNPQEEKKLRAPAHQRLLARAIALGIRRYFENSPPPGTLLAEQLERRLASAR
ncbi:MAG: N-acetylmuramoyl-L-alanine amidase [Chromatiales bacterium]